MSNQEPIGILQTSFTVSFTFTSKPTEEMRQRLKQAGYLFDFAPIEVAARFADIFPIGPASASARQREITLGLNWYPMQHSLKLQLDASYLGDEAIASDGNRAPTERFQARLQLQAYF